MNNDCLANIYNFMETSQVVRMSKGAATERLPTKVELTSISDVDQFNRWCEKFDTRRLQEVTFNIPMREFAAARGYPRAWFKRVDPYFPSNTGGVDGSVLGSALGIGCVLPEASPEHSGNCPHD